MPKTKISMISKNLIKYIRSLEQKKISDREGLFVAEGPKVVGDIMAAYAPARIIATPEWFDSHAITPKAADAVVSEEELRKISFLQHPQQVLALFPIPGNDISTDACAGGLCLALDKVQDPGNLGTIIRIADWFGISKIFCGEGTADTFNPKVIQATMGSIARVDIAYTNLCDLLDSLPNGTPTYATDLNGSNIYSKELEPTGIIIMGNEGKGVSPEVMKRVKQRLLIPYYGNKKGIDSLNVAIATAVTCAEFRRRNQPQTT